MSRAVGADIRIDILPAFGEVSLSLVVIVIRCPTELIVETKQGQETQKRKFKTLG